MSLHLGNITPRVRRDELERVFRRFGCCSVQVKDTFGFVVYDYPVNAERALRTLQGKKICGELLTLSWSNNQPSYRGWNSHGRNSRDESYVNRKLPSYSRHEPCDEINFVHQGSYSTTEDFQQRKGVVQAGKQNLDETCYNCGKLGHKVKSCPEEWGYKRKLDRLKHIHSDKRNYNSKDQDGLRRMGSDPRGRELPGKAAVTIRSHKGTREASRNDGWEWQIDDLQKKKDLNKGSEFDRYEPCSGSSKRVDGDEINLVHQGSYSTTEYSQQRNGVVQASKQTLDQTRNCGKLGLKIQNCPKEWGYKRKLDRLKHIHSDQRNYNSKDQDGLRRMGSDPRGRELPGNDAVTIRSHKDTREASSNKKRRLYTKADYSTADNQIQASLGKQYEKVKRIRESQSPEHRAKKSRRPQSSPIHSDDKVSRSRSSSIYSKSSTRFATNSNFESQSLSSSLTFIPVAKSFKSRNYRSRSVSRSRSGSRVSLYTTTSSGCRSSTPPSLQNGEKGSFMKANSPEQNDVQVSCAQLVENGNAVVNSQVNNSMDTNHIEKSEEDAQLDKGDNLKEQNDTQVSSAQLVENGNAVVNSQVDSGMHTNHIEKSEEDSQLDKGEYPKEQIDTQLSSAQLVENGNAVVNSQVDNGMDTNHIEKSEEDAQLDKGEYPKEQIDTQLSSAQLVENGNAVVHSQVDKGMYTNHTQKSEEDTQLDEGKYPKEQNVIQVECAQLVENGNAVIHLQVDKGMDTNHIQKSEEDTQLDEGEYPKEQIDTQLSSAQLVENGNAVVNSQVDNGMDTNHIEKSEEDAQLDKGEYPKEQIDTQLSSAQLVENGNAVVNSQVDNGMDTNHIEKSEEDSQLDKGEYPKEQNDTQVSISQLVENGNAVVNSQVDNGMDTNHIEKSEEDAQLDKGEYPKEQNDTQVSSAQLVENGNAVVHSQVDKGMYTNHTQKSEEDTQLDEGKYPKEQNVIQVECAQLVENLNAVIHLQVDKGMDTNHIQKSEEDTQLDEGKFLSKPLLENDALNDEILFPTSQTETKDLQSCDLNVSQFNTPSHKTTRSMCLTSEEILMVLKHYGLKQPVEVEKGLMAESFFGCARLWPWEVIYYRRLKKGPISIENYARRIFQNKEFGIVDKYVRSSSGWGEEES